MIQVIKHGYLPEYKAFCSKCSCGFTYNESDVKCKTTSDKYLELVYCPECKHPVDVKERREV